MNRWLAGGNGILGIGAYEWFLFHPDAPCLFANHWMRLYRRTAYFRWRRWHNKRNPTTCESFTLIFSNGFDCVRGFARFLMVMATATRFFFLTINSCAAERLKKTVSFLSKNVKLAW